jgi:outer membrane protein assembly factor BamB
MAKSHVCRIAWVVLFVCGWQGELLQQAVADSPLDQVQSSADWPMWRHNGLRSGASTAELPKNLQLQWTRELPAARPAWPNEPRLHFDGSYEPIVLGSRMFVGSMVDGSMTAFDTKTGDELWRFYTNGPIRLAPVGFDNKICFGSDDGWLYCVDATDGKLLWKAAGAPTKRGTHRHLGNARLVSFWPIRGGPVVADGVVYFGAGIWPTLGVFVHAVDATSGENIWTNGNSHAIENVRVDHNYMQESGLSPQGHMLVHNDMLIVPNGRSMPARFDLKTGKLHYFVQGYRNGDSRVTVSGDIALVGLTGVVSMKDGRELGSRWAAAGKDAPPGWSGPKADLFEGPLFPYKFLPACDYRSVIHDGKAYGVENGIVYAYDLRKAQTSLGDKDFNGNPIKPARWDSPLLWQLKTSSAGKKQASHTIIKAGDRLYAHSGSNLFAIQLGESDKAAQVAWEISLSASPTSMLAANDRLFVALEDGSIQCFGAEQIEPKIHQIADQQIANQQVGDSKTKSPPDEWTTLAASVLKTTGVQSGYAVVVGLENGQLVEQLLQQSQLHVIAIDDNEALVEQLRRRYSAHSQFGNRFQAIIDDPASASLPPYLADLITSESPAKLRLDSDASLLQRYQNLRPYGGSLCLRLAGELAESLGKRAIPQTFAGISFQKTAGLVTLRRTGALPGSAIWCRRRWQCFGTAMAETTDSTSGKTMVMASSHKLRAVDSLLCKLPPTRLKQSMPTPAGCSGRKRSDRRLATRRCQRQFTWRTSGNVLSSTLQMAKYFAPIHWRSIYPQRQRSVFRIFA